MDTKTIYVNKTETRTFTEGEIFDFYIGEKAHKAEVVGFPGGVFSIRFDKAEQPSLILGAVLVPALTAHRAPREVLNHGW